MTFSDTDMKELGRSTQKKITIQDPYLSSMSQTSCSRKKLSQWKNVNTHTHTHTHTHTLSTFDITVSRLIKTLDSESQLVID